MATAIDIINRAFRLIGNNKSGDSGDASEYVDALQSLNDMIADWSITEGLLQYKQVLLSYTLVASSTQVTVGPTGNLVSSYVGDIANPYVRVGTVDYPITKINSEEYAAIGLKSITGGYPEYVYYDAATPNSTLFLFPGGGAAQTIYFNAKMPLQVFAALSDTVTIPNQYLRALAYNLAVEIAPEYGLDVPPIVMSTAAATKRKMKQHNFAPSVMQSDVAMLSTDRNFNILSGR